MVVDSQRDRGQAGSAPVSSGRGATGLRVRHRRIEPKRGRAGWLAPGLIALWALNLWPALPGAAQTSNLDQAAPGEGEPPPSSPAPVPDEGNPPSPARPTAEHTAPAPFDPDFELPPPRPPHEIPGLGELQLVLGLSYIGTPLLVGAVAAESESPAALLLVVIPSIVHMGYSDFVGGLVALLAYPAAAAGGAWAGCQLGDDPRRGTLTCDAEGAAVGLLVAAVVWPLLDVFAVTPALWAERSRSQEPGPGLALSTRVLLDGGATLSLAGEL